MSCHCKPKGKEKGKFQLHGNGIEEQIPVNATATLTLPSNTSGLGGVPVHWFEFLLTFIKLKMDWYSLCSDLWECGCERYNTYSFDVG